MFLNIYPKYDDNGDIKTEFYNLVEELFQTCGLYFDCIDEYKMGCISDVTDIKFTSKGIFITCDNYYKRTINLPLNICYYSIEQKNKDYKYEDLEELEKIEKGV